MASQINSARLIRVLQGSFTVVTGKMFLSVVARLIEGSPISAGDRIFYTENFLETKADAMESRVKR